MERQSIGACVVVTLCLCLLPGVAPALDPTPWGFALDNGDVNGDQDRDVSDGVYLLSHLFLGGPAPVPLAYCGGLSPAMANGDSNGDGGLDVSDPIQLLSWLYAGGVEPVSACGEAEGAGAGKAKGVPRVSPPNSNAFGKSLAEWMETYWRWGYSGGSNMVGRVELLPIPAAVQIGGSGTPADPAYLKGEIDLELEPGTPFVLPQFAWIAETYDPALGIPDDPCIADDFLLAGVTPLTITIDGTVVVSDANEKDFYTPCTPFDPPVVYAAPSSYGSIGAIAYQGVGFVSPPLPVGDHVIHLYEQYVIDNYLGMFSFGVIYDNTWKIHVEP